MQPNKHASLTLLLALSCGLGACTSDPHPTASPTVPTTSSATLSATNTPSPTHSPIGPEGTVLIQDGKAWLESKNGTYTIDIPEEFQYEKTKEGTTFLRSIHDEQAFIAFTPALDIRKVPSLEEAEKSFRSSLLRQTELRRDLTEFARNPASTIQAKVIPIGENDRPDYDGTTLQVLTDIGDTRWGLAFSTASREETEALMKQAADSLTKQ